MSYLHLHAIDLDLPVGHQSLASLFSRKKTSLENSRDGARLQDKFIRVLSDVSLELQSGDRVGLIGKNGAGKSTILRVLAGIYAPSRGLYQAEGQISTLFSGTVGMNSEASGRENIFLSGRTLGMSRAQILAIEQDVIEFTDIGEFIDMPIRLYSAGMRARLGFAVATARNPEILLIDEVFGVGDASFRQQAEKRIEKMMGEAGIIVLASHSDAIIRRFCNKICWIHHGQIRFFGDIEKGFEKYKEAKH